MVVNPLTGKEEPRHGGLQLVRERYLGKRAARYEPYTLKQLRFIKQKLNGTLLAMLGYEIDLEEAAIAIERANARKKKAEVAIAVKATVDKGRRQRTESQRLAAARVNADLGKRRAQSEPREFM